MKENFDIPQNIPPQEKPPQIKIPMKDPSTNQKREGALSAIPNNTIRIPEQMSGREKSEAFETAYSKIVGNEQIEKITVRGVQGDINAFAAATNKITELCLSLSDEEIDSIMRRFNETLRVKADFYINKYKLSSEQAGYLKNGMKIEGNPRTILNPIGVKSVVHFVRNRLNLHSANPKTVPAFYFENHLDAQHKIDFIEMFEREDGMVMNLIQVKSREYIGAEIEKNTQAHREWVNNYALNLRAYENSFEVEPKDSGRYKEFFGKVSHIEDLLVDMIAGETMTTDVLFEKMGLKGVPNVERTWILSTYIGAIKGAFAHVEDVGLTDEQLSRIHSMIDDIEAKLALVLTQKKDLKGISEIHSICTVAERQVSDVVIFKAEGADRKAIYVKK